MNADDAASPDLRGKAAVKLSWREQEDGWRAALTAVDEDGFVRIPLYQGVEFDLELTDERRCVGYFSDVGERNPCPEFRRITSGSQCGSCRRRDVFSGYVEGRTPAEVDADVEFGVYIARCGSGVKVGVTRAEKLERRWIEQGADEAAVVRTGVDSQQALELESRISDRYGIPERIGKGDKLQPTEIGLKEVVRSRDVDIESEVVDVSGSTVYPDLSCSGLERSGRFAGRLDAVKGQIASFGSGLCVPLSSGRVFVDGRQRGLGEF